MAAAKHFHLGLLHLAHLIIRSDGKITQSEIDSLLKIKQVEGIPDELFNRFNKVVASRSEYEIYKEGIGHLKKCTKAKRLRVFVHLYKVAEADNNIHVKEVRLLLYSVKWTGIDFDDVIELANKEK